MSATARERVNRIINGEQRQNHPFDFINNLAFYSFPVDREQESVRRLLAQARVAVTTAVIAAKDMKLVMETGSMSNGLSAYRQILKDKPKALERSEDGLLTTQDMKYQVAHSELMNNVVLPNRIKNQRAGDDLERLLPDYATVIVSDFEAPIRELYSNNALSQGATFQDPIYESFWVPLQYFLSGQGLTGDHAYSRNANPEELHDDLIQAGLADNLRSSPGKDMFIIDGKKGGDVTLSDRAWETAKHIVDVVENGFKTDFSVAALIARFQLDDWLNGPDHGPLDMKKVSPVLADRSPEDKARMAELKKLMIPYIADKCLSWSQYEKDPGLKAYVEKNVLPAQGTFKTENTAQFVDTILSYRPKGGANEFLHNQYSFATDKPANDNSLSAGFMSGIARRQAARHRRRAFQRQGPAVRRQETAVQQTEHLGAGRRFIRRQRTGRHSSARHRRQRRLFRRAPQGRHDRAGMGRRKGRKMAQGSPERQRQRKR